MKNYSINDEYMKINLMIKKDLIEKIKQKAEEEKSTFGGAIDNI